MAVSRVDHSALRTNQASIVILSLAAFILDQPWLVAVVAAVMVVGTIFPGAGLFKLIYAHILRPARIVRPDVRPDDPIPHLFAQGMGAAVLLVALALLLLGQPALGWALTLVVVALAGVNLLVGFCAGCFVYYQLARLGIVRPASAARTSL